MRYYRGKAKDISITEESSHILVSPDHNQDLDIMCAELGITAESRIEKIESINNTLEETDAICRFRDGHKGERFYTPAGVVCATTDFEQARNWARHQAKQSNVETVICEFDGEIVCDLADGVLVKVAEVVAEHQI